MGPMRAPSSLPGVTMATVTAVIFGLVLSVSATVPVSDVTTNTNDVDCGDESLERCLDVGRDFAERYLKKLNKGRKQLGACDRFVEFSNCLQPMMDNCPSIRGRLHHQGWHDVIRDMGCECDPKKTQCRSSVTCLEAELTNVLSQKCFAMYGFNINQGTHGHCHFVQEKMSCIEALVTSSCDEATGHLAFVLLKIAHSSMIARRNCSVHRHPAPSAFRYNVACPRDLVQQTTLCSEQHLFETEVNFLAENDLVASAKKQVIKEACRNLRQHKQCMHSLDLSCPHGVTQYYDFNGPLRTFLWKMNFICGKQKRAYLSNLQCFQRVVSQGLLSQCNLIWEQMKSALIAMTSHAFFCVHDDPLVMQLKEDLDRLRMCYTEVFSAKCNQTAGDVMGDLIHRAFQDPLYLRLDFRADCQEHAMTTTPPTTSTSTSLPKITSRVMSSIAPLVLSSSSEKYLVGSKPNSRGRTRELHREKADEVSSESPEFPKGTTLSSRSLIRKPEAVKFGASSAGGGSSITLRNHSTWIVYVIILVTLLTNNDVTS